MPYLMQISLHQLKDNKNVFELLLIGRQEDVLDLNNICNSKAGHRNAHPGTEGTLTTDAPFVYARNQVGSYLDASEGAGA